MPTVSNKHANAERVLYGDFSGLNLSVPPESLRPGELCEAVNIEYSRETGGVRVRGGLLRVWEFSGSGPIRDVVSVPGRGLLILLDNGKLFRLWNGLIMEVGIITGNDRLSAAVWVGEADSPGVGGGDESDSSGAGGNDFLILCAGMALHKLELERFSHKLSCIEDDRSANFPKQCRLVFVRSGRVGVVDGPDTLRFSHVGDCDHWSEETEETEETDVMPQTGAWLEVGYKDGMDITAVVPLSRDLIVFKSPKDDPAKGIIHRVVGDFPDVAVVEAAHNTGTFSQSSVLALDNDILYLTPDGLAALSTVTQYGDVRAAWPDSAVNVRMKDEITQNARLCYVPHKRQIWVITDPPVKFVSPGANKVWVMHLERRNLNGGYAWTTFEFPLPITCAADGYLAFEHEIYRLHDYYYVDEVIGRTGGLGTKHEIRAALGLGILYRRWQTLIKGAMAMFQTVPECEAYLEVNGKLRLPLAARNDEAHIACLDDAAACEDDEPLVPALGTLQTSRRRCLVRGWNLNLRVVISGGGFCLSSIGAEIAEV